MADYIYLLQTRLTPAQFAALEQVREVARSKAMTVFLVGGAVRDLTSGASIRDLDFAVQGNPLKARKEFQKAGFTLTGEYEPTQSLFLSYPGGVRLEVGATLSVTYPKPGKPVYKPAAILDDLRRRDFTANAMAISLNEGSYGLLMDPLNGVADLENMELRLVSNYGFIEDPVRMIRAARLSARLGWHLEEKTQQRYETGKAENYIAAMSAWQKGYETEEIVHEDDPVRILKRLESEGWMKQLFPAWTAAKVNENELNKLRDALGLVQNAGIHPDPSAAYFPLLTAKLAPKEVAAMKASFPRPGFVTQIEALDAQTKTFGTEFAAKTYGTPSEAWKFLYAAVPEQVLSLAYGSKSAPIQARFKTFFQDSPNAKTRIPYQVMQEMRITPDLPVYKELEDKLFYAMMDAQLETPEAIKAFLEPFSPPAPPPPPSLRRRPVKRETKVSKKKAEKAAKLAAAEAEEAELAAAAGAPDAVPAEVEVPTPAEAAEVKPAKTSKAASKSAPAKPAPAPAKPAKEAKPAPAKKAPAKVVKPAPKKTAAPAKKTVAKKAVKPVVKKAAAPAKKAAPKKGTKPAPKKASVKAPAKASKKTLPAKKASPAKKPAPKPSAKKAASKKPAPSKKAPAKKPTKRR